MARKKQAQAPDAGRVPEPAPAAPAWGRHDLLLGLILVAATLAAYSPLREAGYIWDDDKYIHQNPLLAAPDGLGRIWFSHDSPQYYPLVFTVLRLEHALWGMAPLGYHVVNVVLHALSAVLAWRFLRRVGFAGAFAVGLLFALHPVHVESVAWATELKNCLSGVLCLAALHAWWTFDETKRWRWYALSLAAFSAGLLAKTVIAALPVLIVVLLWWLRKPIGARVIASLLPFLAIGAPMGAYTGWYEEHFVLHGSGGPDFALSHAHRVLVAGRALWFYAAKLALPYPLCFNYARWDIDPARTEQWLWPLAAVGAFALLAVLSRKLGRGLLAGPLVFAIALFPALGFVNVAPMRYSFVADHFQYLASLGLLATLVGAVVWLASRALAPPTRGRVLTALLVVTGLALGAATHARCAAYRDEETLWRDTIAKNPRGWLARTNLAVLLRRRGDLAEARAQSEQVLLDWPDWWEPVSGAETNLGNVDMDQGNLESAASHFRKALAIVSNHREARFNLGNALVRLGRPAEAVPEYEALLQLYPDHVKGRQNYGLALQMLGRDPEAEVQYRKGLEMKPDDPALLECLGLLLARDGRPAEAIPTLQRALQLDPSRSRAAAALQLLQQGR